MPKVKKIAHDEERPRLRPATNPIDRENQMVSLAIDAAERQLLDGTASAQVIVHYLKLGSSNNRLEKEKLENDIRLLQAKVDALEATKDAGERYAEAISAMQRYAGKSNEPNQ